MSKPSLRIQQALPRDAIGTRATPQRVVRLAPCLLAALPFLLVAASCTNPQDDFNAYVTRAKASSSSGSDSSVGPVDANLPEGGFDNKNWVLACESQLGPSVADALLFSANVQFTPSAAGGGTLTLTTQSLKSGATNINSPIAGTSLGPTKTTIAANGTGTVNIGAFTLVAAANAVTMTDAVLANVTFAVQITSATQICASLAGNVTSPIPVTLDPASNPCILRATDSTGTWVPFMQSDFHCP
jgi:hypothetical protein